MLVVRAKLSPTPMFPLSFLAKLCRNCCWILLAQFLLVTHPMDFKLSYLEQTSTHMSHHPYLTPIATTLSSSSHTTCLNLGYCNTGVKIQIKCYNSTIRGMIYNTMSIKYYGWVTVGLPYVNTFSSCTSHTKELKPPSNFSCRAEFKTRLCQLIFLTQGCQNGLSGLYYRNYLVKFS